MQRKNNGSIEEIVSRHPSLPFILMWLEANEDWVLPLSESAPAIAPLVERMQDPPPEMSLAWSAVAADVLNALRASSVLMFIDWIDRHPQNNIGLLFLSDESPAADSFRQRLRHMLALFLRGELLTLFFNKEHLSWVKKYI